MKAMSASNASVSFSPTIVSRGASSTSVVSASPTLLMVASSATRFCVSSMSRAVRSATLRLAARVVSSETSRSSKACSRSRFWREIVPRISSPTSSGTKMADSAGSPLMWSGCPSSRPRSRSFSVISSGCFVSRTCFRKPMIGRAS